MQEVEPTWKRETGNLRSKLVHIPEVPPVDQELIRLTDMGSVTYQGIERSLYPGGSNEMPGEHAKEGLERDRMIQPLDVNGTLSLFGKYMFFSIGMPNTIMESCGQFTDGVNCNPNSFIGLSQADAQTQLLVLCRGFPTWEFWIACRTRQCFIWLLRNPEERKRLGCNVRRKTIEEHSWLHFI